MDMYLLAIFTSSGGKLSCNG